MSTSRTFRVVATGARLVTGAVVAVAAVAGVAFGVGVAWPQYEAAPVSAKIDPVPGDSVVVCGGDFRALGRDSTQAGQMASASAPVVAVDGVGAEPVATQLSANDVLDAAGAQVFTSSVSNRVAPIMGASETFSLAVADIAGLASAACTQPATESWIMGGAVGVGASDVLVLSNAGSVPATATLTVFGASQTSSDLIVPAGTQVSMPLASIAAGEQEPVVQITTQGAPIRATLQSALTSTLDTAGADLQSSAGRPATDLTFAGVQVVTTSVDAATTVLRLLAPGGATEAEVTVRREGDLDPVLETSAPLAADVPSAVNLEGLPAGTYSVSVSAEAPVIGGVWQSTGLGAGTDFAWMTPAMPLTDDVLVAVPGGVAPTLHLVNESNAPVVVSVTAPDGADIAEVTVPGQSSIARKVSAGQSIVLSSTGEVHAALALTSTSGIAGWPVPPSDAALEPMTVYP